MLNVHALKIFRMHQDSRAAIGCGEFDEPLRANLRAVAIWFNSGAMAKPSPDKPILQRQACARPEGSFGQKRQLHLTAPPW
jgi:hypothetical protein